MPSKHRRGDRRSCTSRRYRGEKHDAKMICLFPKIRKESVILLSDFVTDACILIYYIYSRNRDISKQDVRKFVRNSCPENLTNIRVVRPALKTIKDILMSFFYEMRLITVEKSSSYNNYR